MARFLRTLLLASILALPAAALAKPVTLHGKTADVTLEVAGFVPTLGAGALGGQYERLVQMQHVEAGKPALIASVLVDTPPPGFDAKQLPQHVLRSYKARFGKAVPAVTGTDQPPGFWFDFEETSVAGRSWNLYFETLAQGRWLEIHFSATNPRPEELAGLRQLALSVVRTVTFVPRPVGATK
ncbi:MAG: hypothetical protein U1A78_24635 [Polyangia bacterium]